MITVKYQDTCDYPRQLNQETRRILSCLVMLEKLSIGECSYFLKNARIDVVQKNLHNGARPLQFVFLSRKDSLKVGHPISMRYGSPELIELKNEMIVDDKDIIAKVFIKPVEWVYKHPKFLIY